MTQFDYAKAWREVNDFDQKGLPESALKSVMIIYGHARTEGKADHLVKAIIYQLKLTDYKEENAFVKNLIRLKAEADTATFPVKPLLHSMLGEMYWQYYQNNRYRFHSRTAIPGYKDSDIETWSLDKIVSETFAQYKLSLEDVDKSKVTPISLYEEVLLKGNAKGRRFRPTLFDFLAHRALEFTKTDEANITKPAYQFSIDQEDYFLPAARFSKLEITTKDSLSMNNFALALFQELIAFHLADKDPEGLTDIDLDRLSFVHHHHTSTTKSESYKNALVELEQNVIKYPVSTRATFQRAWLYRQSGSLYVPLHGDTHKWDLKRSLEICDSALARFKDSDGAIECENLKYEIQTKSLAAVLEENNLPGLPFRSLIRYRNFTSLYYRIIEITRDEVSAQRRKWEKNYNLDREQKFIEYFTGKTPYRSGIYNLPDDQDFQEHSLEVKLDALPAGEYMVVFSSKKDFSTAENGVAYAFTRVSNISYFHRPTGDGGTDCFVINRSTGQPMAGVGATVFVSRYNYQSGHYYPVRIGSYTSDSKGYFHIGPVGKDEESFHMDFSLKSDHISSQPIDFAQYNAGAIHQFNFEAPETSVRTFFFLDRSIYRPGQTIYLKGLVLNTDGKTSSIRAGHKTKLLLYDVNNQLRQEIDVTTSEYGTYNAVFSAPSTGLTGEMRVEDKEGSGSIAFSVEEYKRPKFEVLFDTLKGTYKINETIHISGAANAYSGASVDGASVTYRVIRIAKYPLWWGYRWGYYPTSPQMEIAHGETKTDALGKFTIDFKAIPDLTIERSSDPTFTYTIYADVTDINGETHSQSTTVSVAYRALLLDIPIENMNLDDLSSGKSIPIHTTNFAGEFEPARGTVKIFRLTAPERIFRSRLWSQPDRALYTKEEYHKFFPTDLFADEDNKFKWLHEKEVFALSFDTGKDKKFQLDLTSWTPGEYVLEAVALDKDGQQVKQVTYVTVYSPKGTSIPSPQVSYFQRIKLNAEPGEIATFTAGTTEKKVHVLYELEQNGKILSSKWLSLSNQQQYFEVPIKETYRGNIELHYTLIKNNRLYKEDHTIFVPYTNKVLNISFQTYRDKLQPGQKEQWKILIKGKSADKVAAEMVAALYDESLDSFRPHNWYADFYGQNIPILQWQSANGFNQREFSVYANLWNMNNGRSLEGVSFDNLNWFSYSFYDFYYNTRRFRAGAAKGRMNKKDLDAPAPMMSMMEVEESKSQSVSDSVNKTEEATHEYKAQITGVSVRKNFNETAFFYPDLHTNENGEIIINFTIPEALTRWKMLGFAHTKDLKYGQTENHLVTQKELMVVPNQPRFFREGDKMTFAVKIVSLVDKPLKGEAQLEFFDPFTSKKVSLFGNQSSALRTFSIEAKQSINLNWAIEIPDGLQAVSYRVVAKAGDFSDGEEMTIPVLTNRMLVTESLPLPIRGHQKKEFRFEKLIKNSSPTLRSQQFALEFTSNPAWYAIQSLPYLMEYPYDCVEQTFSKFYANSIAAHIANSNPRIKQVFDTWKNIQPDALLSNLEKNQELKSAILEETPWVLQASNEKQRKRNVGLLFDLNRMSVEREKALEKVVQAQSSNGGFSWFPGLPEDRYMTQHIVSGLGHLDAMKITSVRKDSRVWNMLSAAVTYMDAQVLADYQKLKALAEKKQLKLEDKQIGYLQIHYLYARSYFKDVAITGDKQEAFQYFLGQSRKYWHSDNLYLEGMACLALHRFGELDQAKSMIRSFTERAVKSEEMGMYWKAERGFFWYQAPVEMQALMIEVFDEVSGDNALVEEMKVWLLKQKQTQDWKTTKATAEACYALLRRGSDLLADNTIAEITVGKTKVDPAQRPDSRVEAGTGYFKTAWSANEITSSMGNIYIEKNTPGVAWGAAYWQYFEQLDKISPAETPLKLKKELFKQSNSSTGLTLSPITDQSPIATGDLVKIRIELRVDRDMEYLHLKDMRAAGFEPVSTISSYRYQDGLYYYESTRDMATNFFIGFIPKGTYVFEYALRASQKGDFSNGVTSVQCMYAPEYASHSQGTRVLIK